MLYLAVILALFATHWSSDLRRRERVEHNAKVAAINAKLEREERERLAKLWGGPRRRETDRVVWKWN